jgi:AcrR family transcriptional regulator
MSVDRGTITKENILKTGLKMWIENPDHVSANGIANRIGMAHGTVLYHFPEGVKDAVAEYAVEISNSRVIAQLIALNHKAIKKMSATERLKHLKASISN